MKTLYVLLLSLLSIPTMAADFESQMQQLQKNWALANYQTAEENLESVFAELEQQAVDLNEAHPSRAEVLIWHAIILSSDAGKNGGLSALGKVKQARELLLQAEKIDPRALEGSIYTSLGSLYYQVPGWPIAYGDDEMAQKYLQKALEINPQGMDANYFYADFLLQQGQSGKAKVYFEKALKAAPRINRPLADQGRKHEIREKLKRIESQT